jgi:uncharacterized protein YndB with AHSA1/START domain
MMAMPEGADMTATASKSFGEREVTITRLIDAPRSLVFKAWTDPAMLAQWWGPKGFTAPICEFDARLGGRFRIHMRAPDGAIYPMRGEIREFVPIERLAFTNIAVDATDKPIIEGLTVVTFADEGGKTRLTVQTGGTAVVDYAVAHLQGMEMGWTMSIDKLEAFIVPAA